MQNPLVSNRRGNVIAFLLMALIAVLAIVVGLLSRANRQHTAEATMPGAAPSEITTSTAPAVVPADDLTTAAPLTNQVQLPPPPPPAFQTPDPKLLPPEG